MKSGCSLAEGDTPIFSVVQEKMSVEELFDKVEFELRTMDESDNYAKILVPGRVSL